MSAEYYLETACQKLPVVNRTIQEHGDRPLSAYLENFIVNPSPSYQERDDFFDALHQYTALLSGETVAKKAVNDLKNCPVILTSNHLGVEFFSQSLQSSLIFSLNSGRGTPDSTCVPVFSCANIPLDNLTYPQGALFYHVSISDFDSMPIKLPIFSNRLRKQTVSAAPPLTRTMIESAEKNLDKMLGNKQIPNVIADTMHTIFQEDYNADSVLSLPDYSTQSAILNRRIWKRLFSEPDTAPEMLCLELEKISSMLLTSDLRNQESLAWCVMFDPDLRQKVLEILDDVNGCWVLEKLSQRVKFSSSDDKKEGIPIGCGTVFFWCINDSGRRIPLCIETAESEKKILHGRDDRCNYFEFPYTPEAICELINKKRLIPSIFTCFLTLSLARGLACVGGYFQGEYLPAIQRGLATALRAAGYDHAADAVSNVPTHFYLSGMLGIMTKMTEQCLIPAGPIEIIAGGGINANDMEQMLSLTVREAHLAGLFETVPDILSPEKLRARGWKKELAADCFRLLNGKAVVK